MKISPESNYRVKYKIATALLAILSLIFLFMMFRNEHVSIKWKQYQLAYHDSLIKHASDERTRKAALKLPVEIQQIAIDQLSAVDRCISCHLRTDDEFLSAWSMPHKSHPMPYLKDHHISEFGCTICHGGQGRALVEDAAHSPEHAEPFLKGKSLQSYCGKCHLLVYQDELNIIGADKLQHGVSIFQSQGCLGCHKIRGTGGAIGPDLTEQGAKAPEAYDYSRLQGNQNIETWLRVHLINPDSVSQGSKMPAFNLSPDSLLNLIIFTRALYPADLPFSYYTSDILREFKNDRNMVTSEKAFRLFGLACHGKSGKGRDYEHSKFGVPHLNNQDFLRLASQEMIYFSIHEGRGTRMMGSWNPDYSGTRRQEISSLANYVQSWKSKAPDFEQLANLRGNATKGEIIYQRNCSMCHGIDGNGGVGPGLNRQSLLTAVDDNFLFFTITSGRANTAMPSWSDLPPQNTADLIKYIRQWQKDPSRSAATKYVSGNIARGDSLFHYLCSRCHGTTGSGGIGPAILYPDFLRVAPDDFLRLTILGGRDHSAMFGLQEAKITRKKRQQRVNDLLTYIKSWQDSTRKFIEKDPNLGNPAYGKILYRRFCSDCHGENGEGIKAPALNNQEFLNAASNGYIIGTISIGRQDTEMPSWGRGTKKYPELATQDRWDIVSYIREWQLVDIPFPQVIID